MEEKKLEEYFRKCNRGNITTNDLYGDLVTIDEKWKEFPLSEGQKALWALQKMDEESTSYNIPVCFKFKKKINLNILEKAVEHIWHKFPILKTIIKENNGSLWQEIDTNLKCPFEIIRLNGKDEKETMHVIERLLNKPFELDVGPLFRVYVIENQFEQIVLIMLHHIISDGTSTSILIKSLLEIYQLLTEKKEITTQIQGREAYASFVKWEAQMLSGKSGEENQRFWEDELSGDFEIVNFPSDVTVNKTEDCSGDIHQVVIKKEIKSSILKFSKKYGINLSSYFLSILNISLYQCTGQQDIIIGMATMGRTEECFESIVGYFVNMIPVRSQICKRQKYINYVQNVQLKMFDCLDHSDYPFTSILRCRNKKANQKLNSLFKVAYYYQNFWGSDIVSDSDKYEDNFNIEFLPEVHQKGEYDIVFEVVEQKDEIILNIKYNSSLFTKELITHYAANMVNLSEKIAENPYLELFQYPAVADKEREKIINEWNDTNIPFPTHKKVHELFQEQVNRTPDRVAVVFENKALTYQELNTMSEKLAIHLQEMGVKPNTLIGICVDRSLDMIVGLMAILKSGGAYVPLDPEYPDERIEYMIENSKIQIILSQTNIKNKKSYLNSKEMRVILLDEERKERESVKKLESIGDQHDLAYVLYTSGSTGKPKGVMITHEALTNFLEQMARTPGINENDVLLAVTTFCFDISGLELYLPLIKGAKCVICSTEKKRNIDKLRVEIDNLKPTIMQATPATWMALYLVGWRNKHKIKILCGGEALPEKLKDFFMNDQSEVWNMFGPTETTIWSTMKKVEKNEDITVGKPIANTQIYILNDDKLPVPINVPGELYIAGTGLAKGYYNQDGLTNERFVDNPFSAGKKMYRTGDIAKWNCDGEIVFIGRADNQVKIHGFRIELNEIENQLNNYEGIDQSAVIVHEHDGNKQLVAFFVGKEKSEEKKLEVKKIRDFLDHRLPVYMIPNTFLQINKLPLTPNGKIDRLELQRYQKSNSEVSIKNIVLEDDYNLKSIQSVLKRIWTETLGNPNIDMDDGFFEVGGDSILAVLTIEKVKKKYKCDLKVTHLFEYPSINKLSKFISEELRSRYSRENIENEEGKLKKVSNSDEPDILNEYNDAVAIIGISCQLPGAGDKDKFWENLINRKECLKKISIEKLEKLNVPQETINNPRYMPISLEIEGKGLFDNEFFNISPKDAEYMNPQMRLLLEHSWRAMEDAGYVSKRISNTGVYMATSNNSYLSMTKMNEIRMVDSSKNYVRWLMDQPGTVPTMISYHLGLTGPSIAVHSNCSSGLSALALAYQAIKEGEIDYALIGAATIHSKDCSGYLYVPGMNFSKEGHIKAFDSKADGMLGGEGVGVIMVKNAKKAIQDHDNIYAILRGISVSNDGKEKAGFYAPSISGQEKAIENTIIKTGISPETISYIEAHGTGTKLGDPIEFQALKHVYEKYTGKKQFCGIGSVKTNVGHLDTVAGLVGCIKLALSLKNRKIPATINFKEPNPEIDFDNSPFYIQDKTLDLREHEGLLRVALSSFGIGGTNVHAIFEEYLANKEDDLKKQEEYIVPISAKTKEGLNKYIENIYDYLKENFNLSICDIAYTLQTGREQYKYRIAFCVRSLDELLEKLHLYLNNDFSISGEENYINNELQKEWISGKTIDWDELYAKTNISRKISLPTYPFSEKYFWIPVNEREKPNVEIAIKNPHCLLDSIKMSSLKRQCYIKRLTGKEFYLTDHVINNMKVLPGVIYIEMARAATENAAECEINRIKNIVWSRPIIVENPCDVNVVVENIGTNQTKYRITTNLDKNEVIHSQGTAIYDSSILNSKTYSQVFPIDLYKQRCSKFADKDTYYNSSLTSVYQYGITFRPVTKLYFNNKEALAYLEIPEERMDSYKEFKLHPSILEGGLQSIIGLLVDSTKEPFMPYAIEDIRIYRELQQKCIAYTTYADSEGGSYYKKFNILLLDTAGHILVEIRNYTIRNIPQYVHPIDSVKENDMQMYHYEWKKEAEY